MILNDFECPYGHITEEIVESDQNIIQCPKCGNTAKKIISYGKHYTANEDAEWIRSVTEVVDKEGGPHCQEFLRNPTRENYKRWMKGAGLRHLEPGEKRVRKDIDIDRMTDQIMKLRQNRDAIRVR